VNGEEVHVKPDALAHLADALTEDIIAAPPHQLAIEEIVEASRSRDLVFRFDDILADASAAAGERPRASRRGAIWNLTDALCEDIAEQPDDGPHEATGGADQALAHAFDDILRRAPAAAAGLTLPPQPSPPPADVPGTAVVRMLDRLVAPLRNRVAVAALATAAAAVIVVAIHDPLPHSTPLPKPVVTAAPASVDAAAPASVDAADAQKRTAEMHVADGDPLSAPPAALSPAAVAALPPAPYAAAPSPPADAPWPAPYAAATAAGQPVAAPSPAPYAVATTPSAPAAGALSAPRAALPPRVALVIGNAAYRGNDALKSPRRDAVAVAEALRQTGFAVQLGTDLDRDGLVKALRRFRDQADHADWALVYFAGHGISVDGTNYVVPIDADLADQRDAEAQSVSYDSLLSAIDGAKTLRLVILDACRSNQFAAGMRRITESDRAVAGNDPAIRLARKDALRGWSPRGLATPPEPRPGTLVVYADKEGHVAAGDADDSNSPFTRAFVQQLKSSPERDVRRLFAAVRDDVLTATGQRQEPFTYGSLPAQDFSFAAAKEKSGTTRSLR
jgi:hypothetical protein